MQVEREQEQEPEHLDLDEKVYPAYILVDENDRPVDVVRGQYETGDNGEVGGITASDREGYRNFKVKRVMQSWNEISNFDEPGEFKPGHKKQPIPEHIDLNPLLTTTSKEGSSKPNETGPLEQPKKWWINASGGSVKQYKDGRIEGKFDATGNYRQLSVASLRDTSRLWRNTAGERIKPTQITSLLTQNPTGGTRPASTFYWWKQPDEGYYIAQAKKGLADFLAEAHENYYVVDENSEHRLKFICPDHSRSINRYDSSTLWAGTDDFAARPAHIGPILIYINPANDQAVWYCPKCSKLNSKKYRGDGHAVKHTITRELRDELARDGIIPAKEYKHADRLAETDKLLEVIRKNPGSSFYELDHLMGWESDGRNSERIINKHLKNKVDLKKGRGKNKGYMVHIKK